MPPLPIRTTAAIPQTHLNGQLLTPQNNTFQNIEMLVKAQYPQSPLIQNGHFELLDAHDRRVVYTAETWKGQDLIMAVVLNGVPPVMGEGFCPVPNCYTVDMGMEVGEGGRHWCVFFYHFTA